VGAIYGGGRGLSRMPTNRAISLQKATPERATPFPAAAKRLFVKPSFDGARDESLSLAR
jgi:hypothetical protein